MATTAQHSTPVPFEQTGRYRFAIYEDYGLDDAETVDDELELLSDSALHDLAEQLIEVSTDTLGGVGRNDETALWCEGHDVPSLVGQTLFWAERYYTPDPLGSSLLSGGTTRGLLAGQIRKHLSQRRLIESGLVVPLPTELAVPWIAQRVGRATEDDLSSSEIVDWIKSQILLEGPTAREVLLVSALDDRESAEPFMFGRTQEITNDGRVTTQLLGDYDATFDYNPWIETVRKQFSARLVQDTNVALGVAELVGGRWLAPSPFRARLARLLGVPTVGPDYLAQLDIPWFPNLDVNTLASIAGNESAVAELRTAVRACIHSIDAGQGTVSDLQQLVDGYASTASGALDQALRTDRVLKGVLPAVGLTGSLVLSATTGPIAFALGALAAVATGAPLAADLLRERRTAAFLFWTARKRAEHH